MGRLTSLAKDTAIYGISSIVGRMLNWLLVPLYTQYLIPSDYGIVTELYAYTAFLFIIYTYGIETAFFRFSTKLSDRGIFILNQSQSSIIITSLIFSSTLILLVAALIGDNWKNIYQSAMEKGYRFLSYGDSSLLLP